MAAPLYTPDHPFGYPLRQSWSGRETAMEFSPVHASFARRYRVRPNLVPLVMQLAGIGGAR